jgi:hypothetical protein
LTWQQWVAQNLPPGTKETSGYRTPGQEAALGGPANSYHTRGTPSAPGAIDVGGPAGQLTALFEQIKQTFAGRINELFLNLPGGTSQDIRNNAAISTNPEAGRPQHLHIALSTPASAIPEANRGGKAALAAGGCAKGLTFPTAKGLAKGVGNSARGAAGFGPTEAEEGDSVTLCWSDVWIYGAGLGLVLIGARMLLTARE